MAKTRVTLCTLGVLLLLSLLNPNTPGGVTASSNLARWSNVNIPTEGKAGNWVLADGSDLQHLTMAADGALYCYATPSGTSYTLFKSADGGYTWSYTGKVQDSIVDIATAPGDANIVYYATSANLYRSTDAGRNFVLMAPGPRLMITPCLSAVSMVATGWSIILPTPEHGTPRLSQRATSC